MKIAICGLIKSENLGEPFISKSLIWLIEDCMQQSSKGEDDIEFEEVDLYGRNDSLIEYTNPTENREKNYYAYQPKSGNWQFFLYYKLRGLAKRIDNYVICNPIHRLRHYIWNHGYNFRKRLMLYYNNKIGVADLIVIDGGGVLEYSYNEYQEYLKTLCDYAEQHSIPIVINAIGRAGEFNPNDFRCKVLMKALSNPCVRYASARDSLESVRACVKNRFDVKLCADAAFWVKDAYDIDVSSKTSEKRVIGIGLIRGDALLSYEDGFGEGFGEEDLIDLFSNIAYELMKRGYDFRFFTNGFRTDYTLGQRVIAKMNIGEEYLIERPLHAEELLNTISDFSGLITCRMHSSIAAFSMKIPSVILSWNKKVDQYMEVVGYPERAIKRNHFNAEYIVDALTCALEEGVSEERWLRMRTLARESVEGFQDYFLS